MGNKYTSQSAIGYNSTPPSDDGTVSESNKVKWSTIKTKLTDPPKNLADAINTALTVHFDNGPIAVVANATLGATHNGQTVQASGAGVTLTLSDASSLGAGWNCEIVSTDTTNTVSVARATASNTINETSADISLLPLQTIRAIVNAAANGFLIDIKPRHSKAFRTAQSYTFDSTVTNNSTVTNSGHTKFANGVQGSGYSNNVSLLPSVAANALTIALKGKDGADPSATNPVELAFRNSTVTTGDYSVLTITSALSLTISSGSTLGTVNAQPARLWVVVFNDAGTARLGVINCLSGNQIYPIMDNGIASSTAEGGIGGADSAQVFYTGTAVTSKPYRIIGYVEITEATAGTWATSHTSVSLWSQGMPLPGAVVGFKQTLNSTYSTGGTVFPYDNTIPQNTEGDQFMTVSITPSNAANLLKIYAEANHFYGTTDNCACALFKDTTANAIAAGFIGKSVAGGAIFPTATITHYRNAGDTNSQAYKYRAGGATAGTFAINGHNTTQLYGGVVTSKLEATEIFV